MANPVHYNEPDQLRWTSFLAPLAWALSRTSGPIVEIGCGHFSTPFLHEFARGSGRRLVSLEDNPEWFVPFAKRFNDANHHIIDQTVVEVIGLVGHAGVAFIDNCGSGDDRANPFWALLPICDFVVLHDYEGENRKQIEPLLKGIKHRIWADYLPATLVATARDHLSIQ